MAISAVAVGWETQNSIKLEHEYYAYTRYTWPTLLTSFFELRTQQQDKLRIYCLSLDCTAKLCYWIPLR